MKKNTAGQVIGAQLVSATDGSAFTGSVTCAVTGDGGTQATGSVGSGACTHEGNGFHTYAPAQAETNYDHIAFTFTGTGAVPVTVQVFTTFPQTGDTFARIGATGSGLTSLASQASVDAVDNFVDTEIAAIQTALTTVDTVVDGIKAVTDLLPDAGALTSIATQASVNTIDDFLDTEIAAIKAKTDQLGFTGGNVNAEMKVAAAASIDDTVLTSAALTEIATTLLDLANGIETGLTPRQALRGIAAVLFGKLSGAGTGTEVFRNAVADSADRVTATVTADGDRTAITVSL